MVRFEGLSCVRGAGSLHASRSLLSRHRLGQPDVGFGFAERQIKTIVGHGVAERPRTDIDGTNAAVEVLY